MRTIPLIVLAAVQPAAAPARPTSDPLDATGPVNRVAASPLRGVTVLTGDPAATHRFFIDAMGMTATPAEPVPVAQVRSIGLRGSLRAVTYRRSASGDAATVRAIAVSATLPVLRPRHDALASGGLAMGMPVHGQAAREARVTRAGFRSAVGVTRMTLPRPGGVPYTVEEIHYQAPDGVLVLGIDRGDMKPVGQVDAASGIGGPAYSSIVVADLDGTARFLKTVLGYEMRRDAAFTSAGSKGGLGLPDGTRFAFQQWFAPGSATGYVIVMKMLDRPVMRTSAAPRRGIAMWSFDIADLAAAEARAKSAGARIASRPTPAAPSLVVAMPDGFLVELTPRKGTGS